LMRTYYDAGKFNSYQTLHTSNLNMNEGWHAAN
jgi:hypothetical protein